MRPRPLPVRGSEYAELSRQVHQAGLLDRRPRYSSIRALAEGSRRRKSWGWEAGLLAVPIAAYLSLVFLVLSPPSRKLARTISPCPPRGRPPPDRTALPQIP